jgi:outer membrane lipoprotein-sorting protein
VISLQVLMALRASPQLPQPPPQVNRAQSNACSMPGLAQNAPQGLKDEELLGAYNAQAALVHSLQASAIVRAKAGSEYGVKVQEAQPSLAQLKFLAPASLRMTGVVPFAGRRTFDLSSDGREFRLLVPDGKFMRFYVGPVDAPPTSANPQENLRPQPIVESLHWLQAKLRNSTKSPQSKGRGTRTIEAELIGLKQGGKTAVEIEFDLRSGAVSRLTYLDAAAKPVTEIQYSNWQRIPTGAEGSGPVCFPKRIFITEPQHNLQLDMKIVSGQINAPVSPSQFQLIPPRGIAVKRLAPPSGSANR